VVACGVTCVEVTCTSASTGGGHASIRPPALFRSKGSECWVSFNPDMDSDEAARMRRYQAILLGHTCSGFAERWRPARNRM
jgi:hypothetical protein